MAITGPLIDRFGRVHTNLRVSVTDRCNIRCFYCMPAANVRFLPRSEILSFEEITRFVQVCAALGITKVRLTGGEPLVRADLPRLVRMLAAIPGIQDLAMTTNGLLLAEHAEALREAGLHRLNISLDALHEETFQRIARRSGLDKVLQGIDAACRAGFRRIRLNAVAIRGVTEPEIIPLAEFARQRRLELRFIEYMPLDADRKWQPDQVLSGEEIRAVLEQHFGPLVPVPREDPSQPAVDYSYRDGSGVVGFINPVTQPFCHECNRLRITAEGQVRNCLFSTVEWDARRLLREGASDEQIAQLVRDCIAAKMPGHGIDKPDFVRPVRAMFEIGG
ncbi:MAG: GTP 3',8-cyclase [Pirellulaceae bacterium]|nr:MAG: GTP 3',8-cyclase [Pirellulaceae bacterium]